MDDPFDWDDYYRDTRKLSPEARGSWVDCLYHMKLSPTRGRISEPMSVYATMLGVSKSKAQRVIDEIAARGVADRVIETDGNVTLINRRMFRKWQEQQDANYRQAKHRNPFIAVTEENGNKDGDLERRHEIVTNGEKSPSYKKKVNKGLEKKIKSPVATRIPDPFPLSSEMIEWIGLNCPGLRYESAHESFVEYWTNNTTAKAKKLDWMMTWRKGMKLALRWQQENELKNQVGKVGKYDPTTPEPPIDTVCPICGKECCLADHRSELQAA